MGPPGAQPDRGPAPDRPAGEAGIERLESARTFIAFLEKVEIEESSRRGLLTLRLPSGESEPIRTEQKDTDRGQALIERPAPWKALGCWSRPKLHSYGQGQSTTEKLADLGIRRRSIYEVQHEK